MQCGCLIAAIDPAKARVGVQTWGEATADPAIRDIVFLLLYTAGSEARAAAVQDIAAAVRDGALPVGERHGPPLHGG